MRQLYDLLHQIDLEGTADTAVLERYQLAVFLRDCAASLDQRSVDVDLSDVVDDDGNLVALLVFQHMV